MSSESSNPDFPFTMTLDPPAAPPTGRGRRVWLSVLAATLGLVALLWILAYVLAGAGVAPGTSVLGVPIGGLSRTEAAQKLRTELEPRGRVPIEASVSGRTISIDPAAVGLTLDADATVARAGGRDWRPRRLIVALFASKQVEPVINLDVGKLDRTLATAARAVERAPRDGDVVFQGARAVPVAPVPGLRVSRPAAGEALRAAYLRTTAAVTLPVEVVEPAVPAGEVARVMTQFARPAVSAPVLVNAGGKRVSLSPTMLGRALSVSPDRAGRLQPALDGVRLARDIEALEPTLTRPARNATIRIVDNQPRIVPAQLGRSLDPKALADAVLAVLARATGRSVTVPLAVAEPAVTTQEVARLGIKEVIAQFRQPFPYASYRVHNIGRAAQYINGTLLEPGEVFSMNDTVKERTPENGYVMGTVISNGRFREELGGGVSTITTAMWTAAFYAGLERVEQRAHSFYISRYKPGLEATVSYGALDLKFRNNSPYGVLISTDVGRNHVTIRMWSTKIWDKVVAQIGPRRNIVPYRTVYDPKPGCVEQPGENGFDVTVTRLFYRGGKVVKSDGYTTHYNPAAQIFCRAAPAPRASGPRAAATPSP